MAKTRAPAAEAKTATAAEKAEVEAAAKAAAEKAAAEEQAKADAAAKAAAEKTTAEGKAEADAGERKTILVFKRVLHDGRTFEIGAEDMNRAEFEALKKLNAVALDEWGDYD